MVKQSILYLSIGSLSQHLEQLELRGVCFLTTLFNMVADVNLLQYAVILRTESQMPLMVCHLHNYINTIRSVYLLCLSVVHES